VEKDVLEKEYRHANNGGLSRKHIFDAVDASLKRLDVEYIGMFAHHTLAR
jgi:aryl-alcohol dehydrogenase-like predicted oxidoreductase